MIGDFVVIVFGVLDGILLFKVNGGVDVVKLLYYFDVFEVVWDIVVGWIGIIVVVIEMLWVLFEFGNYCGCSM